MKLMRVSREYGIAVGNTVKYNGAIFRVSSMYLEDGCSTPTVELSHIKMDKNKPLAVPIDYVQKVMNEGTHSAPGSMLYS